MSPTLLCDSSRYEFAVSSRVVRIVALFRPVTLSAVAVAQLAASIESSRTVT